MQRSHIIKITDSGKLLREASGDDHRKELAKNTEELNRDFNEYMTEKDPRQKKYLDKAMNE